MQLSNQEAEQLVRGGVDALRQGRATEARELFGQVTATGRANGQIWMLLATACRGCADDAGEEAALDRLLQLEPRMIRAHIMKGDCRARAGDGRTALGLYRTARMIAETQQLSDDLASELRRMEVEASRIRADVENEREATLAAQGLPPQSRSPRFRQSLEIMSGRARIFLQEPTGYYFPGLPQIQFFDTAQFNWVRDVELATDAIRSELKRWLAGGLDGFRPYIQSDPNQPRLDSNPLLDSIDWSALFLCENGRESVEAIARCPTTWAVVQAAPLPKIPQSPTIMFSLLRPGARIEPHTGTHNTRLVCHLPLIVPPRCGFRVGNEVREWEEGKLLIFDDTIEHEAWNESDQDRVVLIFDIWRPELSAQERAEIGALFSGPIA